MLNLCRADNQEASRLIWVSNSDSVRNNPWRFPTALSQIERNAAYNFELVSQYQCTMN